MAERDASALQAMAARLRDARQFLNLSQQFVSDQTGIPRGAISDIERGARRVDSLELKRLATVYRLSPSYLLNGEVAPEESSQTVQALARAAEGMTAAEQDEVLRFALFLRNFRAPAEPDQ